MVEGAFAAGTAGQSLVGWSIVAYNGTGGGTVALVKTGTGTQTLTNAQTYTGTTVINGGVLSINIPGSLAAASASSADLPASE